MMAGVDVCNVSSRDVHARNMQHGKTQNGKTQLYVSTKTCKLVSKSCVHYNARLQAKLRERIRGSYAADRIWGVKKGQIGV